MNLYQTKALVVNCNNIVALPIIRSLGRIGVPIVAAFGQGKNQSLFQDIVSKSRYINETIYFDEEDYEQSLLKILITFGVKQEFKPVIFLASDTDLEIISKNRNELADYYYFSLSSNKMIKDLLNKEKFIDLAFESGIEIPSSIRINNLDELENQTKNFSFPYIIKPSWRDNNWLLKFREKKVFQINSTEDLNLFRETVKDVRSEFIIQQLITGVEENIYCTFCILDKNSDILQIGCCQKIRQYPKNFGNTSIARTFFSKQLEDITVNIVKSLKLVGYVNIEFKFDGVDKKFKIIEITPNRFNRQFLITDILGLNLPFALYQMELDKVTKHNGLKAVKGSWLSEVNEIRTFKDYKVEYALLKFIITLLNVRRMEIFSIKDTKPFFKFLYVGIRNVFNR
jgi:predicted ATP-grasp superfamily ATP-dependent carboligase